MKVTKATGSSRKTISSIDLGIADLPRQIRDDIIKEAGEYLVEQVLVSLGDAKSPVSGESFPSLSKLYKAKKVAEGGRPVPDLELAGDLKDALTFRPTKDGLEIGFFGDEADKADGHLKFSGRENFTPKRRFLPAEGQNFKRDIVREVDRIVAEKSGEAFSKSDFSGVESSKELYDVFRDVYGDLPKSAIRELVAGSSDLMDMLIDLDMVGYL